ncbi:hypothetical protein SISSUDRAFT_626198 [Sistotremastrum suecicum HHB10207 ss-3]|uniref:Uncharacterized protein n=1 Tax=Sistotremastrum suecicum HHB10207 ss-3 TaxID=1314776 RepID=A0A165XAH2_9AGAM|nr:hypothetical protein SISSUDRAFT_626198 [Sistotremastrum suecicum HHB10207 ss-3]
MAPPRPGQSQNKPFASTLTSTSYEHPGSSGGWSNSSNAQYPETLHAFPPNQNNYNHDHGMHRHANHGGMAQGVPTVAQPVQAFVPAPQQNLAIPAYIDAVHGGQFYSAYHPPSPYPRSPLFNEPSFPYPVAPRDLPVFHNNQDVIQNGVDEVDPLLNRVASIGLEDTQYATPPPAITLPSFIVTGSDVAEQNIQPEAQSIITPILPQPAASAGVPILNKGKRRAKAGTATTSVRQSSQKQHVERKAKAVVAFIENLPKEQKILTPEEKARAAREARTKIERNSRQRLSRMGRTVQEIATNLSSQLPSIGPKRGYKNKRDGQLFMSEFSRYACHLHNTFVGIYHQYCHEYAAADSATQIVLRRVFEPQYQAFRETLRGLAGKEVAEGEIEGLLNTILPFPLDVPLPAPQISEDTEMTAPAGQAWARVAQWAHGGV